MSAYASDWPPSSPGALPPSQQQSPVTKTKDTAAAGNRRAESRGSGEEKKQCESDMTSSAATPPRERQPIDVNVTSNGGTSSQRIEGTNVRRDARAEIFTSGPSGAGAAAIATKRAITAADAKIEGRLHEEDANDDANDAGDGNLTLQASTSSESFVRVQNEAAAAAAAASALSSSSTHTHTPPPPGGEHNANYFNSTSAQQQLVAGSRSPRERLVERLPRRPAPAPAGVGGGAGVGAGPQGAVESTNLLPRDPPQPPSPAASASASASLGLSVPSPPPGGGPFSTPSRQGMMVPSASGVTFAQLQQQHQQQQQQQQQGMPAAMRPAYEAMASTVSYSQPPPPGRRCIRLRLVEEAYVTPSSSTTTAASAISRDGTPGRSGLRSSILSSFRKKHRGRTMSDVTGTDRVGSAVSSPLTVPQRGSFVPPHKQESSGSIASVLSQQIDRGIITVSWYDGTGSAELNEHVQRSVRRKLGLAAGMALQDVRIIDETVEPNEEIVLCPYIPDGSVFLLKFSLRDEKAAERERHEVQEEERRRRAYMAMDSYVSEAPESPSAAPSPHPSSLDLVQLRQILTASGLVAPAAAKSKGPAIPPLGGLGEEGAPKKDQAPTIANGVDKTVSFQSPVKSPEEKKTREEREGEGNGKEGEGDKVTDVLRQLNELLGVDEGPDGHPRHHHHRRRHRDRSEERKQVVFVLANYFVLFLSLIVISAEIHERAPRWMDWVTTHVDSVQSCSRDSDALYKCVSEGNLAGLVASFIFWITRSAATKNILLFGFDSSQKLWTVVYEALVSALCWGTSYIFIRRGLNPDTRRNCLHKYWKDAVYGSLAGFNAAFLKAVLKNLIPQDQVLDAFETRQLRVVGWLSHIFRGGDLDDF